MTKFGLPSDHYPFIFEISLSNKIKNPPRRLVYNFKRADFEFLNNLLFNLPLSSGVMEIKSQEQLDNMWELWNDLVFSAINTCIPKKKCRDLNKPPWINGELLKAIRKKKTLWKSLKRDPNNAAKRDKFRKMRQRIKMSCRLARRNYLTEIANEVNSSTKRFWSFFSLKNKRRPIPDKMKWDGVDYCNDMARLDAFNCFFQSVYRDHDVCVSLPEDYLSLLPETTDSLSLIQVTVEEVMKLLKTLRTDKATGPDNFPTTVLKECAEALAPSLTSFINFSLSSGFHPTQWKCANLAPVYKKNEKNHVNNYRPISLLPIVSKIQEHCVATRLVPFIKDFIYPLQHGFQSGKSCTTQLLQVLHDIGQALDKGLESDIIYLDFEKAFDSVCHSKLLAKLERYGIRDHLLKWFSSYLNGRLQRVILNGLYSNWNEVKSGIPQGSLLGPTLFLLYVNDMPACISGSTLAMFADDSKCYKCIVSPSDFDTIQADLNQLQLWSHANDMFFQPTKCENLRITRKRASPQRSYTICGTSLDIVPSVKDLGVLVTKDLTWSSHIRSVAAKANRMLGFIKRNCAGKITKEALKLLYISLVRSHLCYCSQVWAPQTPTLMVEIEKVQRRATRFIMKDSSLAYKDRLISLNLLPINYWLEYLDFLYFFKLKTGESNLFSKYFSFCTGRSRRGTSRQFLNINSAKTSLFRNSFFIRMPYMWNALPCEIKSESNVATFKKKLKSFFFNRLQKVFDPDDIRTFKIICCKCRKSNTLRRCCC